MFTKPYRAFPRTSFKVAKLRCTIRRWFRMPLYFESRLKLQNIRAIRKEIEEAIAETRNDGVQNEEVHKLNEPEEFKEEESAEEAVIDKTRFESRSMVLDPPLTPRSESLPERSQQAPTVPDPRIGLILGEKLQFTGILGSGGYGIVYSAVDLSTSEVFAVKALNKRYANGETLDKRAAEFQQSEIRLHYTASTHPNIVSMVSIFDTSECFYVVMDYYPDGDLFTNITEKTRYLADDTAIRTAFLQIVDAVAHCHQLGIYCRDLKPENILLNGSHLAITDFGVATTSPYSEDHGCGSSFYMSPENLDSSPDAPPYKCAPNDLWSLGVILVNLTCRRNPWKQASLEDPTYRAFTKNPSYLKTILPVSDELSDILDMIFESDPDKRISISELRSAVAQCSSFVNTSFKSHGTPGMEGLSCNQAPDCDERRSGADYDPSLNEGDEDEDDDEEEDKCEG